jgi:hypothetical protein
MGRKECMGKNARVADSVIKTLKGMARSLQPKPICERCNMDISVKVGSSLIITLPQGFTVSTNNNATVQVSQSGLNLTVNALAVGNATVHLTYAWFIHFQLNVTVTN